MNQLTPLMIGILCLSAGSILGYFARQSIAKKRAGTIEQELQKKIAQARAQSEKIVSQAKKLSSNVQEKARKEIDFGRQGIVKSEQLLLKREQSLDEKLSGFELEKKEFESKVKKLRAIKKNLEDLRAEAIEKLEKVASLTKKEAREELFKKLETEHEKEILEKIYKLEREGKEKFEKKAKEVLAFTIQRLSLSQAQEITTSSMPLPSEDIKGRIIGKEGRNIKTLEKLTGTEIIIDETPEMLVISSFDPVRRQVAKKALERLMSDGRIQPARIEKEVKRANEEIDKQIQEAGEVACYDTGMVGLEPKLIQLLGRLRFRTSYGQNVLIHSIEVSHLASSLASEIGADVAIAKRAGLLHDIGKSLDHQVEGSHVDIGIKILEKFKESKEVIDAVKEKKKEYPYETLEAVLVQVADQISGGRPGARKDNLENYLKRLAELENIATSFEGVEKAYAIQAGREIRIFVKPEQVGDLEARKIAKGIAKRIQEELRYPGEIKVTVIRESRVIEYAK